MPEKIGNRENDFQNDLKTFFTMEVNNDEGFGYSVFTKFVPDAVEDTLDLFRCCDCMKIIYKTLKNRVKKKISMEKRNDTTNR